MNPSRLTLGVYLLLAAVFSKVIARPLGLSKTKATHIKPSEYNNLSSRHGTSLHATQKEKDFSLGPWIQSIRRAFVLPNTYEEIPRHRYPYYNKDGEGKLIYGYGGQDLYRYSVFKPLDGYFKKWFVHCIVGSNASNTKSPCCKHSRIFSNASTYGTEASCQNEIFFIKMRIVASPPSLDLEESYFSKRSLFFSENNFLIYHLKL